MKSLKIEEMIPQGVLNAEPLSKEDHDIKELEKEVPNGANQQVTLQHLAYLYQQRGYRQRSRALWSYLCKSAKDNPAYMAALAHANIVCKELDEASGLLCSLIALPHCDGLTQKWARETIKKLITQSLEDVEDPPLDYQSKLQDFKKSEVLTRYNGDDSDESLKKLEEGYTREPKNSLIIESLAMARYRRDDFAHCIELLEERIALEGARDSDLYYIGSANLGLLRVEEAVSTWRRLSEKYPNSPFIPRVVKKLRTVQQLSLAPEGKQSSETSSKAVKSCRQDYGEEMPEIEMTNYQHGDGSGLEQIEALLRERPDDPSTLDWAAFANYTLGNHERALELYGKLLDLNPENIYAHYYFANSSYKLADRGSALKHWQSVIGLSPKHRLAKKAKERLAKFRATITST